MCVCDSNYTGMNCDTGRKIYAANTKMVRTLNIQLSTNWLHKREFSCLRKDLTLNVCVLGINIAVIKKWYDFKNGR